MRNTIEQIFTTVNARYGYKLVVEYEQMEKFYPSVKNLCLALEDKIITLEDQLHRRNTLIKKLREEIKILTALCKQNNLIIG